MGLPGKRLSRSSKRRRAAHFALVPPSLIECKQCKKKILPHRVCAYCGTYKGRAIMRIGSKSTSAAASVQKDEKKKE